MDISTELGGHFFMINDPKKKKSILLGRSCVQKLLDNESKYGNMIHKCLKGRDKYMTELFPLHVEDHVYITISRYEGLVRVDLRTFAPKEDNSIQPTLGGVNFSVDKFLSTLKELKTLINTPPTDYDDDDVDDDDDDDDEKIVIENDITTTVVPPKPKKRKTTATATATVEKKKKMMKKEIMMND